MKTKITKQQIKELAHQLYLCGLNNVPERLFDEYFERNYKEITNARLAEAEQAREDKEDIIFN